MTKPEAATASSGTSANIALQALNQLTSHTFQTASVSFHIYDVIYVMPPVHGIMFTSPHYTRHLVCSCCLRCKFVNLLQVLEREAATTAWVTSPAPMCTWRRTAQSRRTHSAGQSPLGQMARAKPLSCTVLAFCHHDWILLDPLLFKS